MIDRFIYVLIRPMSSGNTVVVATTTNSDPDFLDAIKCYYDAQSSVAARWCFYTPINSLEQLNEIKRADLINRLTDDELKILGLER